MSLNAFAKAFVPGGGGGGSAPPAALNNSGSGPVPTAPSIPPAAPTEPPFYRYVLMAPSTRVVETDRCSVSNVSLMFSKRLISSASKGGTGVAALTKFVEEFFAMPLNTPSSTTSPQTGFFVSRELLSLSAPDAMVDLSERDGFLIPLEISSTRGMDVGGLVLNNWQTLFASFQHDYRVTVFGYISVQRGTEIEGGDSLLQSEISYYHYLFVACTPKKHQLVALTAQALQENVPNVKAVLPVRNILQYVLCHRAPIALYFSLTKTSTSEDETNGAADWKAVANSTQPQPSSVKANKTWAIRFQSGNVSATVDSARSIVSGVRFLLNDGSLAWQTTNILRVDIEDLPKRPSLENSDSEAENAKATREEENDESAASDESTFPLFPLDILNLVKQACDECMVPIIGMVVGDHDADDSNEKSSSKDGGGSTSVSEALREQVIEFVPKSAQFTTEAAFVESLPRHVDVEWTGKMFGVFPSGGIFAAPVRSAEEFLAVRGLLDAAFVPRSRPQLLTRSVFATAVDTLAKEQYRSRRNTTGRDVLVIVDPTGKLFAADVSCGVIISLPMCWSNTHVIPHSCVFDAVLTTSLRGDRQYRIIIYDVLMWNGSVDCLDQPFQQRWHHVEQCGIDDETSWPHGSPYNVVILRAVYANFTSSLSLLQGQNAHMIVDAPYQGIRIMPTAVSRRAIGSSPLVTYEWKTPDSVTTFFAARGLVENPEDSDTLRVLLGVRSESADATADIAAYGEEFADTVLGHNAPSVAVGDIIECMLRRTQDGAHWWEILRVFPQSDVSSTERSLIRPWSAAEVDSIVHSPAITLEELQWLFTCSTYICANCNSVSDVGRVDPASKQYYCRPCWEQNGHGDCCNCGGVYLQGANDSASKRFFCENCWNAFLTPRQSPHGAPPPPTSATVMMQVTTRVISLLIDMLTTKGPSADVLELCCGASVVRKWISTGNISRYLGVDVKAAVVEDISTTITNFKGTGASTNTNARYETVVADAFSPEFWSSHLSRLHKGLFHCITCFSGLHYAFHNEDRARLVLASISNALVPNGLFVGSLIGASSLFRRGRRFKNEFFSSEWEESAIPVVGTVYRLSVDGSEPKEKFVIPLDFLVALAAECGLQLLPELSMTFDQVLAKDPKWIRQSTADEKEYLSLWMTVAFRKNAQKTPQQRQPEKVQN